MNDVMMNPSHILLVMKTIRDIVFSCMFLLGSDLFTAFGQDCSWSYQAGGTQREGVTSIVTDLNGNSYIGGKYRSDPLYTNLGELVCVGVTDLFLIKYDPSGNEIWAIRFGGPSETVDELIGSMTLDTLNSRLLITGSFYDTLALLGTGLSGTGLTVFIL
ncbi:MAG: hypothetical protein V1733_09645, partial [bacterium]